MVLPITAPNTGCLLPKSSTSFPFSLKSIKCRHVHSDVSCLDTSHLHTIDLEGELQVGSRGADDQVVLEIVVGLSVGTSEHDKLRPIDTCQVRAHPAALHDPGTWVGRRDGGLRIVKHAGYDEVRPLVVLSQSSDKRELDGLVALEVLAHVDVPSELEMMPFVSRIR